MPTDKSLSELLHLYVERDTTHSKRLMLLLDEQSKHFGSWVDLVKTTPVDSDKFREDVMNLWDKSKELANEFAEVVQDLADDNDLMIEFFESMKPHVK